MFDLVETKRRLVFAGGEVNEGSTTIDTGHGFAQNIGARAARVCVVTRLVVLPPERAANAQP